MMENTRETTAEPRWYMAVAIAALLWALVGCTTYFLHVTADRSALPIDQRAMWDATPAWMYGANAVAVTLSLVGAILLLLRRKFADPVLLGSLVAVVVQFSGLLLVPALRDRTPADAWLLPIVIIAITYAVWYFARMARANGWLR